jgi:DNA helicase II / ATP-dependent DNA helicase PcrA
MPRDYTLHAPRTTASGIDYAAELNAEQLAAVTSGPGQALVIAGAGSGKTRTLTYRVAWLLDNGIAPENILLLTFTNKAAKEMLERVSQLVSVNTKRMWGGTFHSVGNRVLRLHCERIGYRRGFSILDREDQKSLIDTVIASSGVDTTTYRFPKADVLADIFSLTENLSCELSETLDTHYPYFEEVAEGIAKVRTAYVQKKLATNTMDFDDLLALVVSLLEEHEDLRELYQRQFQFVLVDEYQDTNSLQCRMIDMLVGQGGNLMVVGDDAQSIYSWRGADVGNILHFDKRYPKALVHKIETNYRSVPEVLALANESISFNTAQIEKHLVAARPSRGMLPALVTVDSPSAQAQFVAQRILELVDEGVPFSEMAIIYRAHYHSLEIQMELTDRGIPFNITSGLRFFEQAHVKDVAAFMKFATNRSDEVSFTRLVRMIPGVGSASASKLWTAWTRADSHAPGALAVKFSSLWSALQPPKKAQGTWQQIGYVLDELMDDKGQPVNPTSMIQSIVEGVYADYMQTAFKNMEQRQQDLERFADYSTRFSDTAEFLSQLALQSAVDTDSKTSQAESAEDADKVTLTTCHQAKGLEWNAVFAIWLAEGMFPNRRAVDQGPESLEEERRLFYVTATRAKDELYLMFPLIYHGARDGDVVQRPSRFLDELPPSVTEAWNVRSGF